MRHRLIAVVVVFLLLAACGSFGQDSDKATVIFYRYRAAAGKARRATINVDGKRVCSLVNGRYYRTEITPGKHQVTGPDLRKGAEVTLEPGKTYYFQAILNITGLMQVHNVFTVIPVSPEQGQFEIKALKELDASDVDHT